MTSATFEVLLKRQKRPFMTPKLAAHGVWKRAVVAL
jgi:hypothetical protein